MDLLDSSGLTGLEPVASALTGRCSNQLNYNPREIKGYSRKFDSSVSGISEGQEFIPSHGRLANYWAELDLNQRRHIANEFTVRPH